MNQIRSLTVRKTPQSACVDSRAGGRWAQERGSAAEHNYRRLPKWVPAHIETRALHEHRNSTEGSTFSRHIFPAGNSIPRSTAHESLKAVSYKTRKVMLYLFCLEAGSPVTLLMRFSVTPYRHGRVVGSRYKAWVPRSGASTNRTLTETS